MEALQIAAAVLLLAGNFFFVAVEFSVTRARPTMVDQLVSEGVTGAASLKHGVDNIDNYLSACQLGITIASIGLGITAEPVVKDAFESLFGGGTLLGVAATTVAFVLAYATVSMFHVVLGELTPKSLAIARTRRTGLVLLPPMRIFYLVTKPVVDLFNWMGNVILKPFGIPPASEAGHEPHTEEELKELISESRRRGELEPEEEAFAAGAFTFGDRRAREVMVPRRDVAVLSAGLDVRDAALHASQIGHRRLPLCRERRGLDDPIGVVNQTDLLRALAGGEETDLESLARELYETSEATLLDDLLEELRDRNQQIALVRDEHGTAIGIITLEDILEQVVGDIRDEFDPIAAEDGEMEPSPEGVRVPGRARLRDLAKKLDFDPGEHREATVGGFVIERLGHVPKAGEEIDLDETRIVVTETDGSQVTEVIVRAAAADDSDDSDGKGNGT